MKMKMKKKRKAGVRGRFRHSSFGIMISDVEVERDLWYANRLPSGTGWTWTLASRLGHILRTAEELYGARDPSYTILGVEFGGDTPCVWFPGNCRHVVVQITPACARSMTAACFEMAHEAVHLLSPSGGQEATVLEEGLATHFSVRYLREQLHVAGHVKLESYRSACGLVEQLLAIDSGIIRAIRERQPSLPHVTPEHIHAAHPDVPPELAVALSQRF